MGQKVQMDEHEGGFWSPVLCGLAEPVCKTRPWQSRHLPVHCVKKKTEGVWIQTDTTQCGPQSCQHSLKLFLVLRLQGILSKNNNLLDKKRSPTLHARFTVVLSEIMEVLTLPKRRLLEKRRLIRFGETTAERGDNFFFCLVLSCEVPSTFLAFKTNLCELKTFFYTKQHS